MKIKRDEVSLIKLFLKAALAVIVVFAMAVSCYADSPPLPPVVPFNASVTIPGAWVKLAWDALPTTNVAYKIYTGVASGFYTNSADAGTNLSFVVSGLALNQRYYFAATAYDTASGLESDYSNAAVYVPPTNVVVFTVTVLVAPSPDGPYAPAAGGAVYSVTNLAGSDFVRTVTSVAVTNIAR